MSNLWPLALLSPFILLGCGDKEQDTASEDTASQEVEEEDTAEEPEDTASEEG